MVVEEVGASREIFLKEFYSGALPGRSYRLQFFSITLGHFTSIRSPDFTTMASITCPGCGGSFSYGAWSIHLAQTTNPRCHAIYEDQQAYLPGSSDRALSPSPQPDPEHVSGDFFGSDYNEANFIDWGDSDEDVSLHPPSDSNTSTSDAESEYDLDPWPATPYMPNLHSLPDAAEPDADDPMED